MRSGVPLALGSLWSSLPNLPDSFGTAFVKTSGAALLHLLSRQSITDTGAVGATLAFFLQVASNHLAPEAAVLRLVPNVHE